MAVVVFPVVVIFPGERVNVHEPEGKPLNTTDPVGTAQVGCVIVPTVGLDGVAGCAFITTLPDTTEVQPAAFLTVNVYVPAAKPPIVTDDVLPVVVTPPGFLVNVHVPDGKPLSATEPVANVQEGCVIVPTVGADGVAGCTFICTLPEAGEIHPSALVTLNT